MKAARQRLDAGAPVKDAARSVGDWLAHWRATTLAASDRKESTRALYATLSRCHLEPAAFGAIPLDKLRPSDIETLVLKMRAKTKPAKTEDAEPVRALSDATIRQVYTVLRAGPDGAVPDGLILRNPAALVRRPGLERREARHLDDNDVTAVLRAAEASRNHATLVLIAATGLRKGEALALRWDRVDLDALVTGAQPLGLLLGAMTAQHRHDCGGQRHRSAGAGRLGTLKVAATIGRVDGSGVHHRVRPPGRPQESVTGDRGGVEGGGRRGRRRAHAAPLRGRVVARGRGAHQGGGGFAWALVDRDHWRCVRAHLRRHGTGRGERPGAATGDVRDCRLGRVWVAVLRVARAISACPSQRC